MEKYIKELEKTIKALKAEYEKCPNSTVGGVICSLELNVKELRSL